MYGKLMLLFLKPSYCKNICQTSTKNSSLIKKILKNSLGIRSSNNLAITSLSKIYFAQQSNLYKGLLRPISILCIPSSAYSSSSMQPPRRKQPPSRIAITWKSVGVGLLFAGIMLGVLFYAKKVKDTEIQRQRKRSLGKAKIGGNFDLIDHHGNPRKSDEFLGQWLLIYFGFTHCPDICPEELEKLGEIVDKIDASGALKKGIQPLFISVDPLRDGIEAVKKYVSDFHPKLLGLTGSVEKIGEACKAYRVYFSMGPKDDDEDYIVDHTIIIYLVNPEGNFVDYFGQNLNAEQITGSILINIVKYEDTFKKWL